MPELPDVEVFKRYLDSTSLRQKISSAEVKNEKILGEASSRKLERELTGKEFESARRHGNYLFVDLDGGAWLLLHFGMTGYLKYFKDMEDEPPHDRFLITFDNGFHLAFDCQRMLGKVDLVGSPENLIESEGLGPDPLTLDFPSFRERLEGRRGAIKSTLMNQQVFAGIGNVYSDEILFQARIHPKTNTGQLDDSDLENLFDETHHVLQTAIERGANPGEMPDSFLLPHRNEGEECPRSNGEIKQIKVSSRTAYYCPACQPG